MSEHSQNQQDISVSVSLQPEQSDFGIITLQLSANGKIAINNISLVRKCVYGLLKHILHEKGLLRNEQKLRSFCSIGFIFIPLYFFLIPFFMVTISPFLYFIEPVPMGVSHLDDARLALLSLNDEFGRDPATDPRLGEIDIQFLLTLRLVRGVYKLVKKRVLVLVHHLFLMITQYTFATICT